MRKGLLNFNQLLSDQIQATDLWSDGVYAGLNLMPVLHEFLSIQYDYSVGDACLRKQGAYRAAAVIYLSTIRARFGVELSAHIHVRKLKSLLTSSNELMHSFKISLLL